MTNIISFIGQSYCGSTVVNLILGAHPSVLGCGELQRLGPSLKPPLCSVCGVACKFWTPEFTAQLQAEFSYSAIADRADCSVIVDASKPPEWIESVAAARAGHNLIDVCLTKHPMRHLSSMVDNQYYRDRNLTSLINACAGDLDKVDLDYDELQDFIDRISRRLWRTYTKAVRKFDPSKEAPLRLKYEDVIADRAAALSPLLDRCNLEYSDEMNDYVGKEQHSLGGNSGANYLVRRERNPEQQARWIEKNTNNNNLSIFRKNYYSGGTGSSSIVDDKYLKVLPPRTRDYISCHPTYLKLCSLLNYDAEI